MNYTNNVKCDDIKPLERKLFKYIIKQIDYKRYAEDCAKCSNEEEVKQVYAYIKKTTPDILEYFCNKYGVGKKNVRVYLNKWLDAKFLMFSSKEEYDICFSCFEVLLSGKNISDLNISIKKWKRYKEMIPMRIYSNISKAKRGAI